MADNNKEMGMKPIDVELRERAEWLRNHKERWTQGNPSHKEACLVFQGVARLDTDAKRVLSVRAEKYLQKFLWGYLRERGATNHDMGSMKQPPSQRRMMEPWPDLISVTAFNDIYAECVEDVIDMLEKAAAAYDG